MKSFQQCHKIRHEQPPGGRLPLSPAPTPKQAGDSRATCRGTVDRATASPPTHKRMAGKFLFDVFGGNDFLTRTTNRLGLRGYVLDTKFGARYDASQRLVLTRIRQDISAGKRIAGMISPPRQHTSCSPKVISPSAATAHLFHRARRPWILEHPCDSWFWDVPKIQTLATQPRTAWAPADSCILGSPCSKRTFFLVGTPRSECFSSGNHTRHPRLFFALAMVLTMNARFQRTHPLSGVGSSLNASKEIGMGVTDLTPISEPVTAGGYTAVVGSACPCVFGAGSDYKDGSSDLLWRLTIVILCEK